MFSKNKKLLATFIILTISLGVGYQLFLYTMQQKKEEQMIQVLTIKTHQIDAWLSSKKRLIENLSTSLELVNYNKETHLPFMQKTNTIMDTHSVFSGFADGQYIDTQGYWMENFDPRTRPWYKDTIGTKKTTISGPMYYNDISGQKITWWSISSAFFKNGKPFGVISSEILPSMITKQLKEVFNKDLKHLFLFHKETGLIIAAMEPIEENKYIQDIFSKELTNKLLTKKEDKINFINQGLQSFAYTHKLYEAPWALCAIWKE